MNKKEQVDIFNHKIYKPTNIRGPGFVIDIENSKMEKIKFLFCFCGERGMCGRMPQL